MAEQAEQIAVTIRPIPPDTVSAAKEELVGYVEQSLREAGHGYPHGTGHVGFRIWPTCRGQSSGIGA